MLHQQVAPCREQQTTKRDLAGRPESSATFRTIVSGFGNDGKAVTAGIFSRLTARRLKAMFFVLLNRLLKDYRHGLPIDFGETCKAIARAVIQFQIESSSPGAVSSDR